MNLSEPIKEKDLTGEPYPKIVPDNDEKDEVAQDSESVLHTPPSGHGAVSPPDDDSQWDLPCGVGADPSPTR